MSDSMIKVPVSFFKESARYACELAEYYTLTDLMYTALLGEASVKLALLEYR